MPLGPESRFIEDRETIHRPERGGEGRSARKIVPRRALADWDPAGRGHDALATILAQSETRAQDLAPIRSFIGQHKGSPEQFKVGRVIRLGLTAGRRVADQR